MIIGTIVEPGANQTSNAYNGVSAVVFYTEKDAVAWCIAMSEVTIFDTVGLAGYTVMFNTDTGVKRWWYAGTEYTG